MVHRRAACAQGHTNADLARSSGNSEGHNAVNAHTGEQRRQCSEKTGEPGEQPLLEERFGAECLFRILVQPSRLANLTRALEAARLAYEVESVEGGPKAQ